MNINIFKTKEELSEKLSGYIINHHLDSSIALSGGSTPLLLFKDLSRKLNDRKAPNTKFFWVMRDVSLLILMRVILRWQMNTYLLIKFSDLKIYLG